MSLGVKEAVEHMWGTEMDLQAVLCMLLPCMLAGGCGAW